MLCPLVWLCTTWVQYLRRTEEGAGSYATAITGGSELAYMNVRSKLGSCVNAASALNSKPFPEPDRSVLRQVWLGTEIYNRTPPGPLRAWHRNGNQGDVTGSVDKGDKNVWKHSIRGWGCSSLGDVFASHAWSPESDSSHHINWAWQTTPGISELRRLR